MNHFQIKPGKRIILVVPVFPQLSETFIVNKFVGLVGHGWDVHIVCGRSPSANWKQFDQLCANPDLKRRVHTTWPVRPVWLAALLFPAAYIRALAKNPRGVFRYFGQKQKIGQRLRSFYLDAQFVALKPDLIHFEFGALAVGREEIGRRIAAKMVVSFRGYDLNFSGLENPEHYKTVWEKADAIHFLGEDLWRRAQHRGCPLGKPHAFIPPAIDVDFFRPAAKNVPNTAGSQARPLRILSVGRLEWKKGYEFAMQAVKALQARGVACEYRIVGEGSYLEATSYARHQLGLEGIVELIGSAPKEQVKQQLEWADVFLHAAVSEGFCNAVLEAQAMQLPVVCTDADGLPENVEDGVTGFVVPRRDSESMAEKLLLLSVDSMRRNEMGRAGRERVIREFQLQDQINKFSNLYHLVLS